MNTAATTIKIDIYQSASNRRKFLSVAAGTNIAGINVGTDTDFASVGLFKEGATIKAGEKRIGMDTDRVMADIAAQGYALHGAKVSGSVSA